MTETPLVVLTLAVCGTITLVILARALRDVLTGAKDRKPETEG